MSPTRSWAITGLIVAAICGAVWASRPPERLRDISGVWLLEFEGSNFFEGATAVTVRDFDRAEAGWLDEGDAIDVEKLLAGDGGFVSCYKVHAFELRFRGRRHVGASGHLGMWNSRYEVAELIEMKPIPWPECDSPYGWNADR